VSSDLSATSTQETPIPDRLARVRNTGTGALLVATGILSSRLVGLVRQRIFAHYLGSSDAADAFAFAFRVPNVLQNLFGEGVLSASLVPVYSGLLARQDDVEAGRVAGAIAALLAAATSVLVLGGVVTAPWLVALLAPGFSPQTRQLATLLVQVLFPGAALLAMSAWALGILNSHGKFFWSYTAPVLWNAAMIAALLIFGGRRGENDLVVIMAWASVVGSALQLAIQLPGVLSSGRHIKLAFDAKRPGVQIVLKNFLPVVAGRGVVQISGYLDAVLASLVAPGAVVALTYAQLIYMLPVSLFGMSVSAAELPAMSSEFGAASEVAEALRTRLGVALRRVAFFVVPSAMAFLALGDVVVGAIYQGGKFTATDTTWVWGILAGSSIGLLAGTMGRLYASTWYALKDTRRPMRFAMIRVALTVVLGLVLAFPVRTALGLEAKWGVVGLTVGAGLAGLVEFWLLKRSIGERIGEVGVPPWHVIRLWMAAAVSAAAATAVHTAIPGRHPVVTALLVLGTYGVLYVAATTALRVSEARMLMLKLRRR
jgi:putative peptidoglycan lipid II flippase